MSDPTLKTSAQWHQEDKVYHILKRHGWGNTNSGYLDVDLNHWENVLITKEEYEMRRSESTCVMKSMPESKKS